MDGEQFGGLKLTAEIAHEVIFRLNQAQERADQEGGTTETCKAHNTGISSG